MTTLTDKPLIQIRPPSGWVPLNVVEVWKFRDLLWSLGLRDLRLRYKQTLLGVIWVVLQPLLGAGIMTFLFNVLAGMKSESGVPFFVVSYCGMLSWGLFNGLLSRSSASLVGNSHLVSKVYFPRAILPLSTTFSAIVDFLVGAGMLVVLLIIFGIAPTWQLLWLPVWMAMLMMIALGIGFMATALNVKYRDVGYILPVAMQFLMYISPAGYPLAEVGNRAPSWMHDIYMVNPMATVLEGFRWSVLGAGQITAGYAIYSGVVAVVAVFAGCMIFTRMERQFADVI